MPDVLLYMPEEKGLVSIITPVYKTGILLNETVASVLEQSYPNFKLLLIDDGSKDGTIDQLKYKSDPRIQIVTQENQGMAKTRNNGLAMAKGEFLLFLDHDDIIEKDFLQERINYLNEHPETGFVGGIVQTFPDNPKEFLSVAEDIENEMLFFDPRFLTTPSSYLIRKKIMDENNICFNESLSSTADRFLLLQLGKVTQGARVSKGKLLYRISEGSFSQVIKPSLIKDNENFYFEMKKGGLMPAKRRSAFKSLYFFMLAGGYKLTKQWRVMIKYLFYSFTANPFQFTRRLFTKKNLSL
ncbi:MAG TPA: glycosyltransferase [Chitinophagaceae bacterium]|nr:glycosyltransferase [Chitinophagaceae bacterium]